MDSPTIREMQAILWDEVQRIRNGETTPASANAVTNATGKILASIRLQMDYARLTGTKPPMLPSGDDDRQ